MIITNTGSEKACVARVALTQSSPRSRDPNKLAGMCAANANAAGDRGHLPDRGPITASLIGMAVAS